MDVPARYRWVLGPEVRKPIPVSSHSCWTSRNMWNPGLGGGRQRLVAASAAKSARSPLLESNDGATGPEAGYVG
jgi:hypothetical protein